MSIQLRSAVPGDLRLVTANAWRNTDLRRAQAGGAGDGRDRGVVTKARGAALPAGWDWLKYKRCVTTSAVIGGITGTLQQPESLLVGRYTSDSGRLRMAGRTATLTRAQAAGLAPLLTRPGAAHPWPPTVHAQWTGGWHGHEPLATRVLAPPWSPRSAPTPQPPTAGSATSCVRELPDGATDPFDVERAPLDGSGQPA